MEIFIDQRIANEVEMLKRRKDKQVQKNDQNEDDDDDFNGQIQYNDIEHLKEYKQVRVGFEGKQLSQWSSALYYFVIKYSNYPIEPVRIEFPKEFRHQYIIQNTGIYCHPEWSQKYWKQSTNLEQIINRVIQTFHEIPTYSDYPVDLSFVQLCLKKEEFQLIIKANKEYATTYNNKIQEERQYNEKKRQQQLEIQQNQLNPKKKEQQEQGKQNNEWESQENVRKQQQEYQQELKNKEQHQFYQPQQQIQYKQNDYPHIINQQQPQQINQQVPLQAQQVQHQFINPNQQQNNYNMQPQNILNQQGQNNQQNPQFQQQQKQLEQNQPQGNNQALSNNPKIKFLNTVKK